MSAALSSPTSRTEDSLLPAAPSRSLTVVSAADVQQASQTHGAVVDELSASVMDLPESDAGGDQPPDSAPAIAPGPISEEGSSAHGDQADVVMEGTAEPEESADRMESEAGANSANTGDAPVTEESGEQRNDAVSSTGQDAAGGAAGDAAAAQENANQPASGEGGGAANNATRAEGEESEDDDDAASQASSDYDHRFFLENFQLDTSTPSDEETAEMERRQTDQVSALDVDHWAKQSFTQLAANSDPEYQILPDIHQLHWQMAPWHGTIQTPNRQPFTRSPTLKVTNHDGKEFNFGLKVFPHGNDGTEMVSVYLECFESGAEPKSPDSSSDEASDSDGEKPWWEITAQVGCVMYNVSDPSIHYSQKAAHQFTSINPDFGWTRFCGPWTELHKRKHLQQKPLLQNDTVAFVVYIRLINDSTRALWWHNMLDHRTDWDPVLKTGYRGYHVENQPVGYSALISALAVWFEIPAFRKLVESAHMPDPYQSPLDTYQILLMALKRALHDKSASRSNGNKKRITYLDNVHTALIKNGYPTIQNPLDVWATIETVLQQEVEVAEQRGHGSQELFKSFFDNIRVIKYSIEPAFPTCSELEEQSTASSDEMSTEQATETSSEMATDSEATQQPTSVQAVLSLAKHDEKTPDMLHVELPRQTYDAERRRWKKVTTKIDIEETVKYHDQEYQLFGLISHSGELGNLRFNPILRPRGPGSQWLRWSTRCNHTNRGYVVPQTHRQAIEAHQGSGTSSTIAYVVVYIKTDAFKSMVSGLPERDLHDVYNPLQPLVSQTVEEPEKFQVVVHNSGSFVDHKDKIGFINPWTTGDNDVLLELSKQDSIFDMHAQISTMDAYSQKEFTLYRLLLNNNNHRLDPQVRDEKLENDVFMPAISSTYGIHFLLHDLVGDQATARRDQSVEIAQVEMDDAKRDLDADAEKIVAERDAVYQASLPPPEPVAPEPVATEEAVPPPPPPAEPSSQESAQATDDGDIIMSGTEEANVASPGSPAPVPPPAENAEAVAVPAVPAEQPEVQETEMQTEAQPETQPAVQEEQPAEQQTENTGSSEAPAVAAASDAMEEEPKPEAQVQEQSEQPAAEKPKRSEQLINGTRFDGKQAVELISCMSEAGRTLLVKKLNRPLMIEESTAHVAARYPGENRIHYFNLVPTSPDLSGPEVDKFTVQAVDFVAVIETVQKPHNHALVFVKHYYPSKVLLESAGPMLLPRDMTLKETLKRPNSTNELNCYLEAPGEAPTKLRGDASLTGNSIMTGCVLITDPVMPDLMATTMNKRGLPSSVTDFLKPQTGFTTGFGRGWASCETLHGRAHGHGRIIYTDGDAYEGNLVSGRRQGKGTMFYASGNTYRGDWKDDQPNGAGVIVYADTLNKYQGPFQDGRPHGSGGVTYWKKAEAGARICRVCLDEEMNSVLIPCGHMVVCTGCGEQLSECPVCRSSIDRIQRVWDCSQT